MRVLGMDVVACPKVDEDVVFIVGPREIATINTKTGKVTVANLWKKRKPHKRQRRRSIRSTR